MPVYFDTHTHQYYPLLTDTNSFALFVSTHADNWSLLTSDHFIYAVGFHPWFLPDDLSSLDILKNKILLGDVSAIGEIGLDYSPKFIANKSWQIDYFKAQLSLAEKYNLPVSIHARKSLNDVFKFIKKQKVFGVIHGFSGSYEQAVEFLKQGFKLGINGVICNPKAVRYHQLVVRLSLSDIVLETDFPYIKNQFLQPILIDEIAIKIASLKECPVEEVIAVTTETAKKIFLRDKNESSF